LHISGSANALRPPGRRRAALTQIVLAYVALFISIVTNLGLMPMYLKYIDARIYGLWLATGGVIAWLGLLDLGIAGVMGQRIAAAYGRKDHQSVGLYYFNGQVFQIAAMSVLVIGSSLVAWKLPHLLGASVLEQHVLTPGILLAGVSTAFACMNNGQHNTAAALQRPLIPMLNIIIGRLVTVGLTVVLLKAGYGLVSLPLSLAVGSVFTFVSNLFYVSSLIRRFEVSLQWSYPVFKDILTLSPALFAAKTGNALVDQIEPTLVALMISPEAAVVFSITKRAADTIENIVDRVTGSVTAGFAHLFSEGDVERSADVLKAIWITCFGLSVICLGTYMAMNHSFIALWIGERYFGGQPLTLLIAVSAAILILGNLVSMLLGATGDIAVPCVGILIEASVRLGLMMLMFRQFGLAGLPLATIVSSGALLVWFLHRMRLRLGIHAIPLVSRRAIFLALLVGVVAWNVERLARPAGWAGFALTLGIVATVAMTSVLVAEPLLRTKLRTLVPRRV
jgi:O-antigen/teichoic acid export membrane protein